MTAPETTAAGQRPKLTASATDFGHSGLIGHGVCIDTWGSGPFQIAVDGKVHRFEDSDRFGPYRLNGDDSIAEKQWPERHPFWMAHLAWLRQGRRLEDNGVICIWEPLKPTIFYVERRIIHIVEHGHPDAPMLQIAKPAGRAALSTSTEPLR